MTVLSETFAQPQTVPESWHESCSTSSEPFRTSFNLLLADWTGTN
ncbi:hypothetical protein [Marinobacter sp. BGYM27]|nr:hypothetical protein [Marinobacter sp. BGYM27]MDG5498348.1 hypothetical protein [Marinobacter sp. BGYM27]